MREDLKAILICRIGEVAIVRRLSHKTHIHLIWLYLNLFINDFMGFFYIIRSSIISSYGFRPYQLNNFRIAISLVVLI